MMMLKLNSTLCDNSFIESYSMRISTAGGSERVFSKRPLATARGADTRLNRRDYSISFARGLPQGDWRDRESVKVAPEQLDEA